MRQAVNGLIYSACRDDGRADMLLECRLGAQPKDHGLCLVDCGLSSMLRPILLLSVNSTLFSLTGEPARSGGHGSCRVSCSFLTLPTYALHSGSILCPSMTKEESRETTFVRPTPSQGDIEVSAELPKAGSDGDESSEEAYPEFQLRERRGNLPAALKIPPTSRSLSPEQVIEVYKWLVFPPIKSSSRQLTSIFRWLLAYELSRGLHEAVSHASEATSGSTDMSPPTS